MAESRKGLGIAEKPRKHQSGKKGKENVGLLPGTLSGKPTTGTGTTGTGGSRKGGILRRSDKENGGLKDLAGGKKKKKKKTGACGLANKAIGEKIEGSFGLIKGGKSAEERKIHGPIVQ